MAAKTTKKTSATTWEKRYNSAASNQAKMFKRYSNWYDSLYAVVGVTPSPWRSKIFVPILARQTWALVSKFLTLKPTFEVRVTQPQTDEFAEGDSDVDVKAEKAARKLEYDYENPYLDETMRDKLFAPLLDAVVTGTGMAKVCWRTDTNVRYERMVDSSGNVDLTKEKKISKKVGYNDVEPVNIFNVFVSPAASNLYNAPWVIIKEYKTLSELKAVNDAKGVPIYKNLDKLSGTVSHEDDFTSYNYSRNRLMNQQDLIDNTIESVKIFECYEGDSICTYAEAGNKDEGSSWVLLREQRNPYWHGKYPLVLFKVKNRPFQFWGEGIFETTYRLQAAYNDVFNHYMDQWNLAENSMLIVPERANINDYVIEPGGVITYRGDAPPQQFKHSEPDPGQLQMILTYMDQAVEGVTISQYAAGIPNSAADKTKGTASGIEHLQAAAGDLVTFMRTNFTQSVTQIGRMWLSNNQQYMSQPIDITVNAQGRVKTMTVTPADLQGEMQLMVDEASMDPSEKSDRIAQWIAYVQQLEQMQAASFQQAQQTRWATDPLYLNYTELMQDYSEIMDHPQYDKLLIDKEQLQEAMQNSQSPMIMPNERFMLDINELYGSEASQWLQRNGIQPDPARQSQTPVEPSQDQAAQGQDSQGAVTPETLLKADQQAHQQNIDHARLALEAQKQAHDQELAQGQALLSAQGQLHGQGMAEQQANETAKQNRLQRAVSKIRGKQ
jgi:hypothetical protein